MKTHFRRLESAVEAATRGRSRPSTRHLVSRIDKAVQKGALHKNTGGSQEVQSRPHRRRRKVVRAARPLHACGRSASERISRQLVAVVGAAAAPDLEVRQGLGRLVQIG